MVRKRRCCDCGKIVRKDEIALTKKLIDLDSEDYYCLSCLAEIIGCTVLDLEEKIAEFKEQGCTLFM